jgi:GTP-binding protein YchF
VKVGLIGLPEVGKTTLFNALTRSNEAVHAYGVQKDELHLGTVPVPDARFDFAVRVCHPKKATPATIDVTDGGARVQLDEAGSGQSPREKFGADFFAGVRNMDALVLVLRAFRNPTLPEPPGGIDLRHEAERIGEELLLADLGIIEARMERLDKNRAMKRTTPAEAVEHQTLGKIRAHLEALHPVRTLELTSDEERSVRSFAFVSGKPLILVANLSEDELGTPDPAVTAGLRQWAREEGLELVELCAKVEMEVSQMEPAEEREFLAAMGVGEPARDRLVRAAYAALGYISFFTVGEDEVRAWTVRLGSSAVGAAEKIHTDIARTFIRAEVMPFGDFEEAGGWDEAKALGKMRLEGKEYVVRDGDIMHIRNSKG